MWVILPVKQFKHAKLRLADILSGEQRAHFSYLMLSDVLATLRRCEVVDGVTIISSDGSIRQLAERFDMQFLLVESDSGYSADAMHAIERTMKTGLDKVAIIPADVPQVTEADLHTLNISHKTGITLCPAVADGGTNALVFTPPLTMPLLFGTDSFAKYCKEAARLNIPVTVAHAAGLERDIDRPADLVWLSEQPSGGDAWHYVRETLG